MEDQNRSIAGSMGEYPATHQNVKSYSYNGLPIALASNHDGAFSADHGRAPQESISPDASRIITGPLANPEGSTGKPASPGL